MKIYDSYETLPKSKTDVEGIKIIPGDKTNIRAKYYGDITYATKDGIDLHLKMIVPDEYNKKEKYPILCHIQGSAWFKQNLFDHIFDLVDIVKAGYIVAIVEYRPSPQYKFPTQVLDAKSAIKYIYDHAASLNVDTNNIFVSGDSSGGHTAALCWATWQTNQLTNTPNLPSVNAFIDIYGVVDLETMPLEPSTMDHASIDSPESQIIGCNPIDNPKIAAKASVPTYIHKNIDNQPLLILHGNKDILVPYKQSIELYQKCLIESKNVEMYCIDDASHGGSIFYTPKTLALIIDFLNKHQKVAS